MGRVIFTFFSLFCFLVFLSPVFAVTTTISNVPESITDNSFEFDISITGAQTGTNYLRASFFSPGTTNYFGYTFNNTDFYNGSDYSQYLPITISSEGSGSATLRAKIDTNSSYFHGSGDYNLKVRRYTSQSYNTSSNEVTVAINYALPTSTPTPEPASTSTPIPNPTETPIPIKTPTKVPTKVPTKKPTSQPTPTPDSSVQLPPSILGTASATISPTPTVLIKSQIQESPLKNMFLIGGGLVLVLLGILFFTFIKKGQKDIISL